MGKIEEKFDNLLDNYSELEDESDELLRRFKELTSKPITINTLQLCNETKDKFDKNYTKSTTMLNELRNLIEMPYEKYCWAKTYDEKLDELHGKSYEIYEADKKLQKPPKITKTISNEKPQTNKILYLSTILAATLAYALSK